MTIIYSKTAEDCSVLPLYNMNSEQPERELTIFIIKYRSIKRIIKVYKLMKSIKLS